MQADASDTLYLKTSTVVTQISLGLFFSYLLTPFPMLLWGSTIPDSRERLDILLFSTAPDKMCKTQMKHSDSVSDKVFNVLFDLMLKRCGCVNVVTNWAVLTWHEVGRRFVLFFTFASDKRLIKTWQSWGMTGMTWLKTIQETDLQQ